MAERPSEFNRDVRPILADHCFTCHGPDAGQRQAELRLDLPPAAEVLVGGDPEKSEVWRRITSSETPSLLSS